MMTGMIEMEISIRTEASTMIHHLMRILDIATKRSHRVAGSKLMSLLMQ